MWIIKIET